MLENQTNAPLLVVMVAMMRGMVGQRGNDEDVGGCGVLSWWWRLHGVVVVRGDDVGFGGGMEMMKIWCDVRLLVVVVVAATGRRLAGSGRVAPKNLERNCVARFII
nr:hypothetical protein [Tanacetum cinerariifolium]